MTICSERKNTRTTMAACCHIVGIIFLCKCNDSEKHRFELTFAAFSFYHTKADLTPQVSQKLQEMR